MAKPETVKTAKLGKIEFRLVRLGNQYFGRADGQACTEGHDPEDVWRRLYDEAGRADPTYVGMETAKGWFAAVYPEGFSSPAFEKAERAQKLAAKAKLDAAAPLDAALAGTGLGAAVLAAVQPTTLLSRIEKTRLAAVLQGPSADDFVQAAARFTMEPARPALKKMEVALQPHDLARWSVVTLLPFLWQPERHMLLKPDVAAKFAARIGHRFAQEASAALRLDVYESLLGLVDMTERDLADMAPRDHFDIHGFVTVVGEHKEEHATGPYPPATAVRAALKAIRPKINERQMTMLTAHLEAPAHIRTATELAEAAGYDSYVTVNMQYGRLGSMLADALRWQPPLDRRGQRIWTFALATGLDEGDTATVEEADSAHWRWKMRPELVEALNG